jgi:hypothetical protein
MANGYSSLCDDFYLDMFVNTELDLSLQSDTVLTFFERIQKQYPTMGVSHAGKTANTVSKKNTKAASTAGLPSKRTVSVQA